MFLADSSAIWPDMAFAINKLDMNFKQGVPLSSDLQNQVIEPHNFIHIDASTVSKVVEQYREFGSTAPKTNLIQDL